MNQPTTSQRYFVKAELTNVEDQARFEACVETSGLRRADYVRQCCLEPTIRVVPDQNLLLYAQLGTLQITLTRAVKATPTPDLIQALEQVKTMRLRLVGMSGQTQAPTIDEDDTRL